MDVPIQLIDSISIPVIFIFLIVTGLLIYEGGFRIGRWYQKRTPDEKEGATGMLVGSMLGLLALLLAFSVGMASDRFDARRKLNVEEANTIGTAYLRAGYLPEPFHTDIRGLLVEYAPLQILSPDREITLANLERSSELLDQIWAQTEELARQYMDTEMITLFVEAVNVMIDTHESRVVASIYARVPETIIYVLIIGSTLSVGMIGYNAGLLNKRSLTGAVVLVVVLAAVITLIIDLDRPRDGLLIVSQQSFLNLQAIMDTPE